MDVIDLLDETNTALPELPEGFFWEIGEVDTNPGWYDNIPHMVPAVLIKQEGVLERKSRKVPRYGDSWWNRLTIVEYEVEYWDEMSEPTALFVQKFGQIPVNSREAVPAIGRIDTTMSRYDVEYAWTYAVPQTEEGVLFLADKLKKRFDTWNNPEAGSFGLMDDLIRLADEFERNSEGRNRADMPPYGRGVASTYHNAARALRDVLGVAQ
jgi:hypothetical protein